MTARKKDEPRMSAEDRLSIYGILKKNFSFDEDYPLANLGWCFVREGINKEDYGFLKLKAMLEEMVDFVSTSTKEIGGVSQSMFALHEFAPFEEKLAEEEESEDAQEGASVYYEKPDASEISSDVKKENKQSVSEMIADEEKCKKETNTKNNTGKKIDTRNKKETSTESNSSNVKDDKEENDSKKTSATRDEKALNNKNEPSNKKVAKEQKDTKECRKAEGDDGVGVKGDRRSSVAALPSPAQGEIAPSRRLESPKGSSSKQKAKPS